MMISVRKSIPSLPDEFLVVSVSCGSFDKLDNLKHDIDHFLGNVSDLTQNQLEFISHRSLIRSYKYWTTNLNLSLFGKIKLNFLTSRPVYKFLSKRH